MGLISDSPVISPDGATLAVRRWPNPGAETRLEGLWFITVATGAKRQVVQNAAIRPLAWARNGRGVYVAIHRTGEEYDLCFVERYGAITRGSRAGTITAASVSLDDRWVAFESWTRGEPSVQVWDRQTNAVSTVERTAWSPCWQDDALLYIRGGTNIVRWRPGGKSETLFPTSGSFNGHFDRLDAPPRGNVVLASQGGGGYFMVALGAKPIHGVNGGNGRVPALSPDARLVACVDQAGGALQAPPEIKLRRSEL